jgi:hypothetical protein
VSSVTTGTLDGTYGVGERIILTVHYNTRIYIKNTLSMPYLELQGGEVAQYYSGNNTADIEFLYVVQETDSIPLFDYRDTRGFNQEKYSEALRKPPTALIQVCPKNNHCLIDRYTPQYCFVSVASKLCHPSSMSEY